MRFAALMAVHGLEAAGTRDMLETGATWCLPNILPSEISVFLSSYQPPLSRSVVCTGGVAKCHKQQRFQVQATKMCQTRLVSFAFRVVRPCLWRAFVHGKGGLRDISKVTDGLTCAPILCTHRKHACAIQFADFTQSPSNSRQRERGRRRRVGTARHLFIKQRWRHVS